MIVSFFTENIVGRTIVGYLLMFAVPLVLPVLFIKLVGIQGLRHLFSYEPHQTVVHELDPRLKVVYPSLIGILTVLLSWNFVYALVAFTLIPWFMLRTSRSRLRVVVTMISVPAIGMIWSQGLFHVDTAQHDLLYRFPPTLSWLGTPGLSASGLLYGAQQAGRTMAAVSASLILLFTTKPSEIIWAFYRFRLPAAAGLAFTAALRFLPQMLERMTVLLQVMQVRGYDLSQPRWWQLRAWPGYLWRVIACIPTITVPLLIGSLRATFVMAMVADARAFGSRPERTTLREHQTTRADQVALGALVLLSVAVLALVLFGVGNRQV